MDFEAAIRKSIKAYREGKDAENLLEAVGGTKYDREYFDALEEEMLSKNDKKSKKGRKTIELDEVEEY